MRHDWQGHGISGENYVPKNHPYARDLDLFGTGSVFEMMCTAQTSSGRRTLANWLLSPATLSEIEERQFAVRELRDSIDLQENWASLGRDALDQVKPASLEEWMNAPPLKFSRYAQVLAIALPIALLVTAVLIRLGIVGLSSWIPIAVPLAAEGIFAACLLKKTRHAAESIVLPSFELSITAPLLDVLERAQFQSPLLRSLQLRLTRHSGRPSKQIRILNILAWLLDLRRSEYFALLSALILWGTNLAILVERWRERNQQALSEWQRSLGEFEALLCFARYSYENPDHTFAHVTAASAAFFRAESLGHPLLNRRGCVTCDLALEAGRQQILIVSGSNMSGKSTFARSVGVNAVLGLAGAPVRAGRLELSWMQIRCSIATHDSLLDGKSRFQAEVERLKLIMDAAAKDNVLFLLDEVFGGTNSGDRFYGVKAILDELLRLGAIGLITTHDLALTNLVVVDPNKITNVHFDECYQNGRMHFDYVLRLGVLTRTNGWNIMVALGLFPPAKKNDPCKLS